MLTLSEITAIVHAELPLKKGACNVEQITINRLRANRIARMLREQEEKAQALQFLADQAQDLKFGY